MKPDIFADIEFLKTSEGGRRKPIPKKCKFIGFPFVHDGEYNDCRLILESFGEIKPGEEIKEVPIAFLCPELVLPKIREGQEFDLWEAGIKAKGKILKILKNV